MVVWNDVLCGDATSVVRLQIVLYYSVIKSEI